VLQCTVYNRFIQCIQDGFTTFCVLHVNSVNTVFVLVLFDGGDHSCCVMRSRVTAGSTENVRTVHLLARKLRFSHVFTDCPLLFFNDFIVRNLVHIIYFNIRNITRTDNAQFRQSGHSWVPGRV